MRIGTNDNKSHKYAYLVIKFIVGCVFQNAEHALVPITDIKIQLPCIIYFLQHLTQISTHMFTSLNTCSVKPKPD